MSNIQQHIEQTTNTAATAATTISDKITTYMDQAEKIISQYGPDAAHLGLKVFQIQAIAGALTSVFWTIIWFIALKYVKQWSKWWITEDDGEGGFTFIAIVLWIMLIAAGLGVIHGYSIWDFIGAFKPEVYAVAKVLIH